MAERGVAGAEIVEREAGAELARARQQLRGSIPGFPSPALSVSSSFSVPRSTLVAVSAARRSASRSWPSIWREEMLRLAKIGGLTSSARCQAASSRAVDFQRKGADVGHHAGGLGLREELAGRQHAEARMAPARRGLEAGDGAILQPHDRLKQHEDLAAIERAAQIAPSARGFRALGAHVALEQPDAVAAGLLGVGRARSPRRRTDRRPWRAAPDRRVRRRSRR